MIAQFIDSDGVFLLTKQEDVIVSNGELVKNKSKIAIDQSSGQFQDDETLMMLAKVVQT